MVSKGDKNVQFLIPYMHRNNMVIIEFDLGVGI